LQDRPVITKPGVRTRSTMAIALGAAEAQGTRRAIASAIARALSRRPPLRTSAEVLTPVLSDPPSVIPFLVVTGTVLFRPATVARLAGDTVRTYDVTLDAIQRLRSEPEN
jgi:hypothetical protein